MGLNKAIISHFHNTQDAVTRLSAVGLNSIPSWFKPFHVLSTGERFRASLARTIQSDVVVDEFTSVVDRNVAKSAAFSIQKYIRSNSLKNIVFATCHKDIIEWLMPDWVFNTNDGSLKTGFAWTSPMIEITIEECSRDLWKMFSMHHYLSSSLLFSAKCFLAKWNDEIVGFNAVIAMPSGSIKRAVREHRLVILPDFQGLGIGKMMSEQIGDRYICDGYRYFLKTSHPRLGHYRNQSKKWRATSKNQKKRTDVIDQMLNPVYNGYRPDANRVCFSHEYIGE